MSVIRVTIVLLVALVSLKPDTVHSHARLWEPPGRSTMWRRGYSTPINYQDNELFCGGFSHQVRLGYKCGVCGDPYDGRRENEAGGKYANGIVTRTYRRGQRVTFQIDVTATHKGYFEFKICPTNNPKVKETQECFNRYPLRLADGSGTKYFIPQQASMMSVDVVLPSGLTCDFCVLQWRYHTGNSWGTDPNGKSCVGCGPQEEFYACADIRIVHAGASDPVRQLDARNHESIPRNSGKPSRNPVSNNDKLIPTSVSKPLETSAVSNDETKGLVKNVKNDVSKNSNTDFSIRMPNTAQGNAGSSGAQRASNLMETGDYVVDNSNQGVNGDNIICKGTNGQPGLDDWCQLNCQSGFCPQTHCACVAGKYVNSDTMSQGCRAAGAYAQVPGYDEWCKLNCGMGNCPVSLCVC